MGPGWWARVRIRLRTREAIVSDRTPTDLHDQAASRRIVSGCVARTDMFAITPLGQHLGGIKDKVGVYTPPAL